MLLLLFLPLPLPRQTQVPRRLPTQVRLRSRPQGGAASPAAGRHSGQTGAGETEAYSCILTDDFHEFLVRDWKNGNTCILSHLCLATRQYLSFTTSRSPMLKLILRTRAATESDHRKTATLRVCSDGCFGCGNERCPIPALSDNEHWGLVPPGTPGLLQWCCARRSLRQQCPPFRGEGEVEKQAEFEEY